MKFTQKCGFFFSNVFTTKKNFYTIFVYRKFKFKQDMFLLSCITTPTAKFESFDNFLCRKIKIFIHCNTALLLCMPKKKSSGFKGIVKKPSEGFVRFIFICSTFVDFHHLVSSLLVIIVNFIFSHSLL